MNKIFKYKAFVVGFLISFVSFFLMTDLIDKKGRSICFDCGEKFGFPFYALEMGGQAFDKHYLWLGLIGNILVALIFSFAVGLIFKFTWSKISSRHSSLK
jgi:hypothetical protein